ncbi:MAG TPA: hypothetical protein VGP48_02845 [Stellaceae bacterium]|jgi:hypothetical protein|nr:hypothetical protein [Stellaceae bacterium]
MSQMADPQGQIQPIATTNGAALASRRQAILVLGMHRSGTSALTGVANALGAAAPKTTLGADNWNQRGYFESARLFVLLDELLAAAGSRWDDWRPLDPQWFRSPAAASYRQKIAALLVAEFDDAPLIVVKDPRICRFVPFVASILAELGFRPVALLPVRNPLEVARSLQRRDKFAFAKTVLLWLRHVLDAEFHSRAMPRHFLPYDGLLADWRYHMDRAGETVGIAWPNRSTGAEATIDAFLALDLQHEKAGRGEIDDRQQVPALVRETYGIFNQILAAGETSALRARLDSARTEFDAGCELFGSAIAAEELAMADAGLIAERNALAAANSKLIDERDALAAANDAMRRSRS